jgi:hypothetical protein
LQDLEDSGTSTDGSKILDTWDCVGSFDGSKVPVEHFMLNFLPTIRKMKIDLLMNRRNMTKENVREVPIHMEDIVKQGVEPQDFNFISDITLAKYLRFQSEYGNKQFFE